MQDGEKEGETEQSFLGSSIFLLAYEPCSPCLVCSLTPMLQHKKGDTSRARDVLTVSITLHVLQKGSEADSVTHARAWVPSVRTLVYPSVCTLGAHDAHVVSTTASLLVQPPCWMAGSVPLWSLCSRFGSTLQQCRRLPRREGVCVCAGGCWPLYAKLEQQSLLTAACV